MRIRVKARAILDPRLIANIRSVGKIKTEPTAPSGAYDWISTRRKPETKLAEFLTGLGSSPATPTVRGTKEVVSRETKTDKG